jgi:predicted TIM-barrel fold metal-dependent hydrolase
MASVEGLKEGMARNGITHSVALPIEPYGPARELLSLVKEEEGLIPFASVDPSDPGMAGKLRDCVEAGCRGIKLHPIIQDFHPSGTSCMETVEEFSQYELPVFFHSGVTAYYLAESESEKYGDPVNYVKTLESFPKVKFVLGHMAMFQAAQAIDIAEKYNNVYFDTSFQPLRMISRALDRIGEGRVMFGTDWPFGRQHIAFGLIMKLTEGNRELRDRLFWKNAESLIGEVG